VRLGTCIALELAAFAGAVVGAGAGIAALIERGGDYAVPVAEASGRAAPQALPRGHLFVSDPEPITVFGVPDDVLLGPLGGSRVTRIKFNRGGTSLSLRLDFANGTRAAFKPEQVFPQSDPRREIAAYRIDRLLGIGHVPPAKVATIPLQELIDAVPLEQRAYAITRLDDAIVRGSVVHGELSWWIPEIKLAALGRLHIDEREGRELWTSYLQVGAVIPPEHHDLVAQIATMVVFDVLIDNADRWSGGNAMMSPDARALFFMDNTLAFSIYRFGHEIPNAALRRLQVFPRALIHRLRGLTAEAIARALELREDHGLGPLLTDEQIRAILARRDNILAHVDRLIAEHGESAILAMP
jgi:hypothetical protein